MTANGREGHFNFTVVGLEHRTQRERPDDDERTRDRQRAFGASLERCIVKNRVGLVAEEAGDDREVARRLQEDENNWSKFTGRPPLHISFVATIAHRVVARSEGCEWIDIRPPDPAIRGDDPQTRPGFERRMVDAALSAARRSGTNAVILICGEDHRAAIVRLLEDKGVRVTHSDSDGFR
jgi:hypothetical protein